MDKFKSLNYKRGAVKRQLTMFHSLAMVEDIDIAQLEERFIKITEVWTKFEDLNIEIECILANQDEDQAFKEHVTKTELYEKQYYEAMAMARLRIEQWKNATKPKTVSTPATTSNVPIKVKLPPLSIEPFQGKYEQWLSFRDSFTNAVHDQDIPLVQKFQILKGLLKDDALRLISALEATDANYQNAWELLENRYANTRLITGTHIKGLFDLQPVSKPNPLSLRQLVDKTRMHLRSLKSLGKSVENWDTILIHLVTSKLDSTTREEWEKDLADLDEDHGNQEEPTLEELLKFLEKRCKILEMIDQSKSKTENPALSVSSKKERKVALAAMTEVTQRQPNQEQVTPSQQMSQQKLATKQSPQQGTRGETTQECYFCKGAHLLFHCENFLKLNPQNRYAEIRRLQLCINCLRSGHTIKDCRSSSCRKCNGKHNTLLHKEREHTGNNAQTNQQAQIQEERQVVTHCAPQQSRVILSTAEVYINDAKGNVHKCRALLDSGSQTNMMSESLAKKLSLKGNQVNVPVSGVNQAKFRVTKSVWVTIKSTVSRFTMNQEFLVIPSITESLPQVRLDLSKLQIPKGIELADPMFHESRPVDLLLGAAAFWKSLQPGENVSAKNQPTFQNTQFGWIVGGECLAQQNKTPALMCNYLKLEDIMERFWKVENLNTLGEVSTQKEHCETHFQQTHIRLLDGRFQLRLPQNPEVVLGNSFEGALQRLQILERRLNKNPHLKEEYLKFLTEYKTAGHMSLADEMNPQTNDVYYVPHQAVVRDASLTTKVRVVFDASHKTDLGTSLNDKLLPGPNLQNDLIDILLRFRCRKYVVTADIKQMFRQIVVDRRDRDLQRILWREDSNQPVQVFTLNTVTNGTLCAPFLAMRWIRQLAHETRKTDPNLAKILEKDFYMDDLFTGTSSIQEAISLQQDLSQLLLQGQFCLRKWRANDPKILSHLTSEKAEELLVLDQEAGKTLGLMWNSSRDILQYTNYKHRVDQVSKRKILSAIASMFDPLGLIGPVLISAKILIQDLWKCQLSWDDEVPTTLNDRWVKYVNSLGHLSLLEINRNVNPYNVQKGIVLHGFCDASEKAFGACVYVASINDFNEKQSHLLCSKSKVAPLSTITLPRLELQAAVLLARLVSLVKQALRLEITETHLWSDSTIALCWIATPPSNLKTFVSHRVAEIQELTHEAIWHHVPSKENPADHLSRGVAAEDLSSLDIWWNGTSWIGEPKDWPPNIAQCLTDVPERKTIKVYTVCNDRSDLLIRFSTFSKLSRVVAYCLRFVKKLRKQKISGALSVEELEAAQIQSLKWLQEETFPLDVNQLRTGKPVHAKSLLLSLKPVIDQHGLIRVGGRLRNAILTEDQKHQIILPAKHPLTHAILREEHVKFMHCGPQQLLFSVRLKYWPLSGAREARKVTRQCVLCFRYRPKTPKLIMGDLPASRVAEVSRPFETTGVDYAGPIMVRESKRRGKVHVNKGYVVVFVCFSTKAIHLELVSDLSTETFLAAFRRFSSRRGLCRQMYSDNGTNFVGAARELKEVYDFLTTKEEDIKAHLASNQINWSFIPPRSPHFGGLWESAVKSMKRHLLTITKNTTYTYEEYNTLLTEVEAVLNSRPLTPMSAEPNDLSILTPSHFLIGSALLEPPTKSYLSVPGHLLSRWKHLQKLKQDFSRRWKREYLHHLQVRSKWTSGADHILSGSMVLLMDENTATSHWPLGRVTKVFPGADGVMRVVDVKTSNGILRRSVKKLCILPVEI